MTSELVWSLKNGDLDHVRELIEGQVRPLASSPLVPHVL